MRLGTRVFYVMLGLIAMIGNISCGGKNKAAGASFTVNPSKPVVITADADIDEDKKVTGPWFAFSVSLTNNTDEKITLVALEIEVTGLNDAGIPETKTVAFTPGENNHTVGDSLECKYYYFGTWDVGETKSIGLPSALDACNFNGIIFYAGSNFSGPAGNSFHYKVKVKPAGWFGDFDSATDRFTRDFTFYTQ